MDSTTFASDARELAALLKGLPQWRLKTHDAFGMGEYTDLAVKARRSRLRQLPLVERSVADEPTYALAPAFSSTFCASGNATLGS